MLSVTLSQLLPLVLQIVVSHIVVVYPMIFLYIKMDTLLSLSLSLKPRFIVSKSGHLMLHGINVINGLNIR